LSAAAAILSEETEERVHLVELRSVDHRPAIAAHSDESGRPEPIKVKGQGIRCEVEGSCDSTRWHPLGSGLNEKPEYIKPIILGERGKSRDNICLFHISTNIEIQITRQAIFQ
jgi:hypothetical protein